MSELLDSMKLHVRDYFNFVNRSVYLVGGGGSNRKINQMYGRWGLSFPIIVHIYRVITKVNWATKATFPFTNIRGIWFPILYMTSTLKAALCEKSDNQKQVKSKSLMKGSKTVVKYLCVDDFGDSIIGKLNHAFSCVVDEVTGYYLRLCIKLET